MAVAAQENFYILETILIAKRYSSTKFLIEKKRWQWV